MQALEAGSRTASNVYPIAISSRARNSTRYCHESRRKQPALGQPIVGNVVHSDQTHSDTDGRRRPDTRFHPGLKAAAEGTRPPPTVPFGSQDIGAASVRVDGSRRVPRPEQEFDC